MFKPDSLCPLFFYSVGKYMYIEASSPRKPGEKAKLMLTVPYNGKQSCLSFYYHVYGSSAGKLNVYSGNKTIFNVSGNQGDNWVMVESNGYLDRDVSNFLINYTWRPKINLTFYRFFDLSMFLFINGQFMILRQNPFTRIP